MTLSSADSGPSAAGVSDSSLTATAGPVVIAGTTELAAALVTPGIPEIRSMNLVNV
jgi:hypothetical protein